MADFKVQSEGDNYDFVFTRSFRKIYTMFRSLKNRKGRFVLIIGSPGTGKSANIYSALEILNLDVYDPTLLLDDPDMSSSDVFNEFYQTLRQDLGVKTNEDVYKKVQEYDMVLLADKILDSEFVDKDKVGLSLWSLNKGFDTFPFYFGILIEYFKHRKELQKINVVIQTALVFRFKGVKYDILTDLFIISPVLVFILNQFFEVIPISYSKEETRKIVKKNFKVDDKQIISYIDEYGCKPRVIFERLEKELKK